MLPLPFPHPLASVELLGRSKGGLNQDRLRAMLSIRGEPTQEDLFGTKGPRRRIAFGRKCIDDGRLLLSDRSRQISDEK